MGTTDTLDAARIDRTGRQIRAQLASLRRRKLILAGQNAKPARDRTLDPFLGELQKLRIRLDFQIRKVAAEIVRAPIEDRALTRAQEILDDAAEMIDLLIWFGAEMPAEDAEPGSSSQSG